MAGLNMTGEALLYAPPEVIAVVSFIINFLIGTSLIFWCSVKIDAWFDRRKEKRHAAR